MVAAHNLIMASFDKIKKESVPWRNCELPVRLFYCTTNPVLKLMEASVEHFRPQMYENFFDHSQHCVKGNMDASFLTFQAQALEARSLIFQSGLSFCRCHGDRHCIIFFQFFVSCQRPKKSATQIGGCHDALVYAEFIPKQGSNLLVCVRLPWLASCQNQTGRSLMFSSISSKESRLKRKQQE